MYKWSKQDGRWSLFATIPIRPTLGEEPSPKKSSSEEEDLSITDRYKLSYDQTRLYIRSHGTETTNKDFDAIVKRINKANIISTIHCHAEKEISTLAPLLRFPHVVTINFNDCNIKDITVLSQLKALRSVTLIRNKITDVTPLIPIINNLRKLDLAGNPLDRNKLLHLISHIKNDPKKPWLTSLEEPLLWLALQHNTEQSILFVKKEDTTIEKQKNALQRRIAKRYIKLVEQSKSILNDCPEQN
jgi:hypothetical protein